MGEASGSASQEPVQKLGKMTIERAEGIEKEAVDLHIAFHPDLTGLQLRIGGCLVTDEEMENLTDRYPLTKSAALLSRTGPAFLEPLDNDEATVDEEMDEDDDVEEEANALLVFDGIHYGQAYGMLREVRTSFVRLS
ncbi:hypothetical protein H5410_040830 [Solanum commersonii]|uniref:Uncharacterized protein n=1 Tax=Solanum commersonii TaxID=4109 RepID=A0A9J5XSN8_SOLCO|nr:hypothetical protein H5410_040830 [Solanum commersonii]